MPGRPQTPPDAVSRRYGPTTKGRSTTPPGHRARIDELRRAVDRVAGSLGIDEPVETGVSGRFGAFVTRVRGVWAARTEEWAVAAATAEGDMTTATEERAALLTELGVVGSFRDALATTRASVDRLAKDIAAEQEEIAGAGTLRAEREDIVARSALFDRIARDLNNARFVRFLLDDERVAARRAGR